MPLSGHSLLMSVCVCVFFFTECHGGKLHFSVDAPMKVLNLQCNYEAILKFSAERTAEKSQVKK